MWNSISQSYCYLVEIEDSQTLWSWKADKQRVEYDSLDAAWNAIREHSLSKCHVIEAGAIAK